VTLEEPSLLAVERQNYILTILERDGVVRTTELKDMLGVSFATIRADLRELEAEGTCEIVWGGAIARNRPSVRRGAPSPETADGHQDAKRRIGARAAQLLETGQTVILDAGSTTVQLIYHISPDVGYVRVVTPALNVAVAVAQYPQIELLVTGGILRHLTRSLVGSEVCLSLQMINADWTFLASGGFSLEHGVTTSNTLEAEVKRAMLGRGKKVVLLADSSKLGKVLSLQVAPIKEIDMLITDSAMSDDAAERFASAGLDIVRV
jgi:DeoR/GlpR family transcriptional regulator of sugar metabolism